MRAASESIGVSEPTFFVDRSFGGKQVVAALRAAGVRVEAHDDHFARDAKDEHWLAAVGEKGWVVLTKDLNIRYRAVEIHAARAARVALFIYRGKGSTGPENAKAIVAAVPAMLRLLDRTERPFIAHVTRSGHVELRSA